MLRRECEPVESFDQELASLLDGMFVSMDEANGIGLAGPQVGVSKRLFVINIPDKARMEFINPEIVGTSVQECVMEEGCLSLPDIWGDVKRPVKVKVQAQDRDGKPFTVSADGLFARCIQHEFDHLKGVLFIDHLPDDEKKRAVARFKRKNRRRKRRG